MPNEAVVFKNLSYLWLAVIPIAVAAIVMALVDENIPSGDAMEMIIVLAISIAIAVGVFICSMIIVKDSAIFIMSLITAVAAPLFLITGMYGVGIYGDLAYILALAAFGLMALLNIVNYVIVGKYDAVLAYVATISMSIVTGYMLGVNDEFLAAFAAIGWIVGTIFTIVISSDYVAEAGKIVVIPFAAGAIMNAYGISEFLNANVDSVYVILVVVATVACAAGALMAFMRALSDF